MPSTEDGPSPAPADRPRRVSRLALAIGAVALAAIAWILFVPPLARFESHPRPAADYEQALQRIDSLRAADGSEINPDCRLVLLSHGRRTARVVVLLHGLTNCPRQLEALGRMLYDRGANVLIARVPHHGFADRMTRDLPRLPAAACDR